MKLVSRLKIAAEILTGLWIVFMLYHQIARTINGDFRLSIFVINLFCFLIFYGFLMWGAWKIPWLGLVPIALGLGAWIIPMMFGARYSPSGYALGTIVTAPLILAGLLFIFAAWKTPKATV